MIRLFIGAQRNASALVRSRSTEHLRGMTRKNFSFRPDGCENSRLKANIAWSTWYSTNRLFIRWNPTKKRFTVQRNFVSPVNSGD